MKQLVYKVKYRELGKLSQKPLHSEILFNLLLMSISYLKVKTAFV